MLRLKLTVTVPSTMPKDEALDRLTQAALDRVGLILTDAYGWSVDVDITNVDDVTKEVLDDGLQILPGAGEGERLHQMRP